jgi:hypothetical protein
MLEAETTPPSEAGEDARDLLLQLIFKNEFNEPERQILTVGAERLFNLAQEVYQEDLDALSVTEQQGLRMRVDGEIPGFYSLEAKLTTLYLADMYPAYKTAQELVVYGRIVGDPKFEANLN